MVGRAGVWRGQAALGSSCKKMTIGGMDMQLNCCLCFLWIWVNARAVGWEGKY